MRSKVLKVSDLLRSAATKIAQEKHLSFSAPELEARILFEHVSDKNHSWQIAHSQDPVELELFNEFQKVLTQRLSGTPIAFITGSQDFWSLNLAVSDCTLIPRQDTECLVEAALSLSLPEQADVVDLGTGTGAIALALAKERASWRVMGIDRIADAVELAQQNALRNHLKVDFLQSDWLHEVAHKQFHLIVSNPPYVESDSEYLKQGDLRFEPASALSSGIDGLDDIRIIIEQGYGCLHEGGFLLLEHGYTQAESIRELLYTQGFISIATKNDYNGLERVTLAQKPD